MYVFIIALNELKTVLSLLKKFCDMKDKKYIFMNFMGISLFCKNILDKLIPLPIARS